MRTLISVLLLAVPLAAQQAPSEEVVQMATTPVFKAETVSRTTQAVNYERTGLSTRVDFVGTAQAPGAKGKAKIQNNRSILKLEIEMKKLPLSTKFGSEYLTYVVWAISPDGRASNLGEILVNKNGDGKLNATTEMQVFGMIVTAEPYYAVRQPSDVIVATNEIRKNTRGKLYFIDAKFELLKRGQYAPLANPLALTLDLKASPLELYEARNAVQIAKMIGAAQYAPEVLSKAEGSLKMAEGFPKGQKRYRAEVVRTSRQAVQFAEDARELSTKREEQALLDAETKAAADREAAAKAATAEEARKRAEAEAAQKAEEQARELAEQQREEAEQQKAAADTLRLQAELAAARESAQRAEAETGRAQAMMARQRAQEEAEKSRRLAEQADAEKRALRARLLQQFSMVLETRDTERGLVVNLSDVLFDVGKADLRSLTREKLARLSGIVLAYPDLKLRAEGHTDSTGTEEINERLSRARADAVVAYMASQGIAQQNLSAIGLASTMPVASNDTREGRSQNRRVEMIISGSVIGTDVATADRQIE